MAEATSVEIDGEQVRITSPDRVVFPRQGWTKLDVVNHFRTVSEGCLRGVFGRPTMMKRYMKDVETDPIYHKRASKNTPFETAPLRFPSQRPGRMNVPRTRADILRLVQLGCLDLHPWPVRAEDLYSPDELRLDFDPTDGFSFDFYQTRRAVLAFGREMERRYPEVVTTKWWKEERRGVFIDYNQNAWDKTVSSAYGVRPTGFVSAPLTWDELPDVEIEDFPLDQFARRYETVGDLTDGIDEQAGGIEPLLEWVARDEADGIGDAPWPPNYPKMPGEPPRVQPSRMVKANWE